MTTLPVTAESVYLRTLARDVVTSVAERTPIRAALLAGSAGRGDADRFSDLDILVYVDALPADTAGGEERWVHGVRTEVTFFTVAELERQLDRLLVALEDVVSPWQKLLSGIDEALPLCGEPLVVRWKARVRPMPEPFRQAMITGHWSFFALWYHGEAMAERDGELWRLDVLLDGAFNLLGVLAGLNRLYFARFELKRTGELTARMTLAPPALADRIEALFTLSPSAAATAFGELVEETRRLVMHELPELDLKLPRPLESRREPSAMPAGPTITDQAARRG